MLLEDPEDDEELDEPLLLLPILLLLVLEIVSFDTIVLVPESLETLPDEGELVEASLLWLELTPIFLWLADIRVEEIELFEISLPWAVLLLILICWGP